MAGRKPKVAILCGGMGLRLKGHMDGIPKALVRIGPKPILWHIMKHYEHYGFRDFILCLGHMGGKVKDYFRRDGSFNITYADTGIDTGTGGRIKRIEKYIKEDLFMATYGDGLSDIDIGRLLAFHEKKGRVATITCVRPHSPFGMVNIDDSGIVASFEEKPLLERWINGGFFVFDRKIFKHLGENDALERRPFEKLAGMGELAAYKFKGFWECMDTYKDHLELNELWAKGESPWAKWPLHK